MGADPRKADEIQQSLIQFGARCTRIARNLPGTDAGRYISRQIMRSGLAAAPNYAEARAADSRADFIHKLRIVLKELNETKSWLEQIVAAINSPPLSQKTRNFVGSLPPLSRRPADQAVQSDISAFRI
jgi:four helix bundle protein